MVLRFGNEIIGSTVETTLGRGIRRRADLGGWKRS